MRAIISMSIIRFKVSTKVTHLPPMIKGAKSFSESLGCLWGAGEKRHGF